MSFHDEFELLLRARYPLIYIPTYEEERVEAAIRKESTRQGNRAVYTWDFVDGYQGNPNDAGFGRRNPLQALELVETTRSCPSCFHLADFHRFWRMFPFPQTPQSSATAQVPAQECSVTIASDCHYRRFKRSSDSFGVSVTSGR
jgi:hypothetical protein